METRTAAVYNVKWRTDWHHSSKRHGRINGSPLPKQTDFGPAVCSSTDPPMPQPAALRLSPRNVLRQHLTIFSSKYYQVLTALSCWG